MCKKTCLNKLVVMELLLLSIYCAAAFGSIIYVDDDASPGGDGQAWATSYNYLQDALAAAVSGDEIWGAAGTYYPSVEVGGTGDRFQTFQMINGVAIYGGFAGTETALTQRNVQNNETILSGDIGVPGETSDNCYHVFYHPDGINLDATAVIDGFTITGGNADISSWPQDTGGGMVNFRSSPTVINCTFSGNSAHHEGGGMDNNLYSSPTVTNCTFVGNSAGQYGGGMSNSNFSSPTVTDCTFNGNFAVYHGGGMGNSNSSPEVTGCTFSGNSAGSTGGGMNNWYSSNPTVTNCTFSGNSANHEGGGMYNNGESSPTVTNCTFAGNSADDGGGMGNDSNNPTVKNCNFTGNTARFGGGLFTRESYGQARPPAGKDYIAIAAGYRHGIALKVDGSIVAWGNDYFGQASPPAGKDYIAIAGGDYHSLALKGDGSIVGWGYDAYGQASPPSGNDYVAISAHAWFSLALKADGSIVGWGDNDSGQASPPAGNDYVAIAAGPHHGLALKVDGSIVGWGNDYYGQASPPAGNDYVAIAAGDEHGLALKVDGSIVGWGRDFYGRASPPVGNDYVAIAAGTWFSSALKADGSIMAWGWDRYSQASPPAGNDYVAIAAGSEHSLALRTDGSIVGWPNFYLTLTNSTFNGNIPDGVWMKYSEAVIEGTVEIASNDWIGSDVMFSGDGELQVDPNSVLDLDDSRISCNIAGTGNIQVDAGTQLIIEGNAIVNLSGSSECNPDGSTGGLITVEGSLLIQGNATLENTNVDVKLLEFGADNDIQHNNIILKEASTGFGGEFYVDNLTTIICNTIESEGDRYLDLDPDPESAEHPTIINNQISVIIKEGVSGSQGTLLELRAADYDFMDSGAYQVSPDSPGFTDDPSINWVLEKLVIKKDAKLNLTNRQGFEFQDFSDPNIGDWETVYVKELMLYPDAVLNTAFQTMYYQDLIIVDYDGAEILRNPPDVSSPFVNGSRIEDIPLLGFSLAIIAMDDQTPPPHNEFDIRVRRRLRDAGDIQPQPPEPPKEGSIERIDEDPEGQLAIPSGHGGVMDMRTRAPGMDQASSVAAKGAFARAGDEDITIEFEYMFVGDPDDEAELIVYLSDEPEVGDNLVEVARIRPPQAGRPGAIGSGQFAVFTGTFWRGDLNFTRGTYVELELRGRGARCWIDNWDPSIHCGLVCGDYGGWLYGVAGVEDYLLLLSEYGLANPGDPDVAKGCLDLVNDGVINANDLMAWSDEGSLNYCPDRIDETAQGASVSDRAFGSLTASQSFIGSEPLMIFGKPGRTGEQVPGDYLYEVSLDGVVGQSGPAGGNGRVLSDGGGETYQISAGRGIVHLGTGSVVAGPSAGKPYGDSTVSVSFDRSAGITVMDAAFSKTDPNVIYVVPVLVTPPDGDRPFRAAARLALSGVLNDPNYMVQMLYGTDPNTDSTIKITSQDSGEIVFEPDIQHQSEIEVDDDGNVYVLSSVMVNSPLFNYNDFIVIYNAQQADMSGIRVCLNDSGIEAPVAMTVSGDGSRLYLTSSVSDSNDLVTQIYSFAISKSGQEATGLSPERIIDVYCPPPELCILHEELCSGGYVAAITSMTEDPDTGTLYATGFTAPKFSADLSELPEQIEGVYTTPFLAMVPPGPTDPVIVMEIADEGPDPLALGISVVWAGGAGDTQPECGGADITGSNGRVDSYDFAVLASQWRQTGDLSADIAPYPEGDGVVDLKDLAAFAGYWLDTNCN